MHLRKKLIHYSSYGQTGLMVVGTIEISVFLLSLMIWWFSNLDFFLQCPPYSIDNSIINVNTNTITSKITINFLVQISREKFVAFCYVVNFFLFIRNDLVILMFTFIDVACTLIMLQPILHGTAFISNYTNPWSIN